MTLDLFSGTGIFLLGTIFGSFVSMASYRIAEHESFWTKHSYCPHCHHSLNALDLVPLFSWLYLRGKCRYCRQHVAWHYPLTELCLGIAFVMISVRYGITPYASLLFAVTICLAILIKVDFSHYLLPDSVQLILFGLGIAHVWLTEIPWIYPLLGATAGIAVGLLLRFSGYLLKKQEAFGWGDVKFLGVAGIFLCNTPEITPIFLLLSGIIGIMIALYWRFSGRGILFPFGPALTLSLFFCLLFPETGNIIPALALFFVR